MKKMKWIIFVVLGGILLLSLFGCTANKYKVDYCGIKSLYQGAKNSYRAGKKVTVYYEAIATDTDYVFYLDDERLNYSYDDKKGFVITFVMPEHDVKLSCQTKNSMTIVNPLTDYGVDLCELEPDKVLVNYSSTDPDSGKSCKLILKTTDNPAMLRLESYTKESVESPETMRSCTVPDYVADMCYYDIDQSNMRDWGTDGICLDGVLKVCEFYDNGTYVRCSTESIPKKSDVEVMDTIGDRLMTNLEYCSE